jgi:hypothetical protein
MKRGWELKEIFLLIYNTGSDSSKALSCQLWHVLLKWVKYAEHSD